MNRTPTSDASPPRCEAGGTGVRVGRATRRRRSGLTLIEIAVVMAIMMIIMAVGVPAVSGLLDLQQRAAAKEIAQTYIWMIDEAELRNVTFRVAYNLDASTWKVEVGDPDTVVFATPEEREEADEKLADDMKRYTARERDDGAVDLREEDEDGNTLPTRFEGLSGEAFTTEMTLPSSCHFAFVYTPQYGEEGMEPHDADELDEIDPEDQRIAYTYVFPDGTAEHTVVRIVGNDDPEDGYTIEVQPLNGQVSLSTDLVDPTETMKWLPETGPEIR